MLNPQLFENAQVPPPLEELACQAATCTKCDLSLSRTNAVFSDGSPKAPVMLIGEGPGQHEDEQGIPFVGRSGQLLTRIFESVGLKRGEDVYICNTVKCRPPNNRKPETSEMEACAPYLYGQIYWVRPKIILLCGATAVQDILGIKTGITKIRGQWFDTPFFGAKAMPIFHPSYLLRNAQFTEGSPKWLTHKDMQEIRRTLDAQVAPSA